MRKHVEESVATGVAAGRGRGGRFSAGRTVLPPSTVATTPLSRSNQTA